MGECSSSNLPFPGRPGGGGGHVPGSALCGFQLGGHHRHQVTGGGYWDDDGSGGSGCCCWWRWWSLQHTVVRSNKLQGIRGGTRWPHVNMLNMWGTFRNIDCLYWCRFMLGAVPQKVGRANVNMLRHL